MSARGSSSFQGSPSVAAYAYRPATHVRSQARERTFMVRRFDRHAAGARIHFASAMTLTGHEDGDDASTGASYLEIVEIIISHGAAPRENLIELWSRIVFNIMVSNTDDHLRNHGFLLMPSAGWRLSPAYDMNAVPGSSGLSLNVDESDNVLHSDLVRSVAPYFRIEDAAYRQRSSIALQASFATGDRSRLQLRSGSSGASKTIWPTLFSPKRPPFDNRSIRSGSRKTGPSCTSLSVLTWYSQRRPLRQAQDDATI